MRNVSSNTTRELSHRVFFQYSSSLIEIILDFITFFVTRDGKSGHVFVNCCNAMKMQISYLTQAKTSGNDYEKGNEIHKYNGIPFRSPVGG